jgi:hypothetical protein
MTWQPIETAPRDGRWILLEGEFAGGDTSSIILARWNPRQFETGIYEWQALMPSHPVFIDDGDFYPLPNWNWYCDGRGSQWMPLPEPPEQQP